MSPELGLAIYNAVTETGELIVRMISEVNEVRTMKSHCDELCDEAKILHGLLDKHRDSIDSIETVQDLRGCFTKILLFMVGVHTDTWRIDGKEVFWIQEYKALLKEIARLKERFIFESAVS
jgi:hypothetical protein